VADQSSWPALQLSTTTDPSLVPQTVAQALNVHDAAGEPITKTLRSTLKDKQTLLVLDNCEHLLDASAHLVDAILHGCPKVRVLASSREALRIAGEMTHRVPSLSFPDPKKEYKPEFLANYEAVMLFVERAQLHQPGFAVTQQNGLPLASICHHLDGIPLAIELAAARVRALPVEEINRRLDERFRLLTGESRTALRRQQTLRSLIDWSYDLLNETEKALLNRGSVFAGCWRRCASMRGTVLRSVVRVSRRVDFMRNTFWRWPMRPSGGCKALTSKHGWIGLRRSTTTCERRWIGDWQQGKREQGRWGSRRPIPTPHATRQTPCIALNR